MKSLYKSFPLDKKVVIYRYGGRYSDDKKHIIYYYLHNENICWTRHKTKALILCYEMTLKFHIGRLKKVFPDIEFLTEPV